MLQTEDSYDDSLYDAYFNCQPSIITFILYRTRYHIDIIYRER